MSYPIVLKHRVAGDPHGRGHVERHLALYADAGIPSPEPVEQKLYDSFRRSYVPYTTYTLEIPRGLEARPASGLTAYSKLRKAAEDNAASNAARLDGARRALESAIAYRRHNPPKLD